MHHFSIEDDSLIE